MKTIRPGTSVSSRDTSVDLPEPEGAETMKTVDIVSGTGLPAGQPADRAFGVWTPARAFGAWTGQEARPTDVERTFPRFTPDSDSARGSCLSPISPPAPTP